MGITHNQSALKPNTGPNASCCASAPSPSKVGLYIGCYNDCDGAKPPMPPSDCAGNRDMKPITCPPGDRQKDPMGQSLVCYHKLTTSSRLEECNAYCTGYKYYGVQYGNECFCSNSYGSMGKGSESDCNSKCSGNSSQICGGRERNSVYARGSCRPL